MKKQLLLLVMILLPMVASADAVEIEGIYYNLVTKAQVAEVTKNPNQYSGKVVIPETVTYDGVTYSVTSIEEFAFQSNTGLTSLTMANSIKTIGTYAFSYCTSLSNLVLSEGLTEIASYAFWHCESLESVIIPKSVIKIGWAAFCDCTKLKNVDMSDGLEVIGDSAFYHSSVVEANIPQSVTTIGQKAFSRCEDLISVSIPGSVTTIGTCAFGGCSSLTSVVIPESVTSFDGLFQDCTNLVSVNIPNGVTQIGNYSFSGCSSLTSVIIPSNVTSIGDWAFFGCSGLTSITLPNSVTNIGLETFKNCSGLTTVTIGSEIESIGSRAFASCQKLEDVYCYAKSVPTTSSDAFLDSYVSYTTLHVYKKLVAEFQAADPWKEFNIVALPSPKHNLTYYLDDQIYKGPLSIEEEEPITPEPAPVKDGYTFSGWTGEPTVMPDHDVDVKGYFTINNYTLTYMVDDVEYKSYEVEYGAAITPEPAPEQEGYTFSGWSEIPETMPAHDVMVTGSFAVNQYTITYIIEGEVYFTETVDYGSTIVPPTAPEREGYVFAWDEYPETMPAHDLTITGTYTKNEYYIDGTTYQVNGDEVVVINGKNCAGKVVIPSTIEIDGKKYDVTAIGDNAFTWNMYITSVTISDGIKKIGANAFNYCIQMVEIIMGKDVSVIGNKAFANIITSSNAQRRTGGGLKVSCYAETLPETASDAFEYSSISNGTLLVDDNIVNDYKTTEPWSQFGTIMGFNETSGVKAVWANEEGNAQIFSLDGKPLNEPQKGVNIVRMSNGQVRKVVLK